MPAAVSSLGLTEGVLSARVATAIIAAALISLAVCTFGVGSLMREEAALAHAPGI